MRLNRAVAVLAGAVLLIAGAASAASATPTYPPAKPTISISSTSPVAGQDVTVNAAGFKPRSGVTVTTSGPGALGSGRTLSAAASTFPMTMTSLTTDLAGAVTTVVHFTAAGEHTITIAGFAPDGAPATASTTVMVRAAAGSAIAPVDEPSTSMMQMVLIGVALLLLALLAVVLVRRRRHAAAPAAVAVPPKRPAHVA